MDPPAAPPLRIFLVEDSALLREVLGDLIGELAGVRLHGEAAGEEAALAQLAAQPADLVIVDLELRQGSGFGVLRELQADPARYGRPRALVFSTYAHPAVRQRCLALGAAAFFDKAEGVDALVDYLQAEAA